MLTPNTTHATQPLDVACFKPAKAMWSKVCLNFFRTHQGKNVTKDDWPSLSKVVEEHLIANPHFAVAGFRACGIKPFNRHAVDKHIIGQKKNTSSLCKRPIDIKFRKEVLKCLDNFLDKRFPPMPPVSKARRRKIQSAEGEIFTSEESMERLRQDDLARAAAPKRKRGRPGRGRGRGRGRLLDLESDRSIVTGPIDQFLSNPLTQSTQQDHLSTQEEQVPTQDPADPPNPHNLRSRPPLLNLTINSDNDSDHLSITDSDTPASNTPIGPKAPKTSRSGPSCSLTPAYSLSSESDDGTVYSPPPAVRPKATRAPRGGPSLALTSLSDSDNDLRPPLPKAPRAGPSWALSDSDNDLAPPVVHTRAPRAKGRPRKARPSRILNLDNVSDDPDDPGFTSTTPAVTSRAPRGRDRPRVARPAVISRAPRGRGRPPKALPPRQKKTLYTEISSQSSSDEELVPFNEDTVPVKKLRVNTHIIWEHEKQHYPAIIRKKGPQSKWFHVSNMQSANPFNLSLWRYGIAQKVCLLNQIKHIIPTPIIQGTSSGRGNETYLVSIIARYWDGSQK